MVEEREQRERAGIRLLAREVREIRRRTVEVVGSASPHSPATAQWARVVPAVLLQRSKAESARVDAWRESGAKREPGNLASVRSLVRRC